MMAASLTPPPPLFLLPNKVYQKRAHSPCTHSALTRIYDQQDRQRCTVCNRVPDFGYLYRCTQETEGNLPISDFIEDDLSADLGTFRVGEKLSNLCHLRPDSRPTENGTGIDEATDEKTAQAFDGKRKFETAFSSQLSPMTAPCTLKICHACRPVYQDRAWQSLNSVLCSTPTTPLQFELDNRRISNAATIIKMRPSIHVNGNNGNVTQHRSTPPQQLGSVEDFLQETGADLSELQFCVDSAVLLSDSGHRSLASRENHLDADPSNEKDDTKGNELAGYDADIEDTYNSDGDTNDHDALVAPSPLSFDRPGIPNLYPALTRRRSSSTT